MSRIGKQPVPVPADVEVNIDDGQVVVSRGSHQLAMTYRRQVTVRLEQDPKAIVVERRSDSRNARALHGLTRSLLFNMVEGLVKPFTKELEINGVGWSATLQAKTLSLSVGYADARKVKIPDGLDVQINGNRVKVSGADKQKVGQFAADVRRQRPPEPYNAKGIRYIDEQVVRKQGKAFAATSS